jgi:hypothetical protein
MTLEASNSIPITIGNLSSICGIGIKIISTPEWAEYDSGIKI